MQHFYIVLAQGGRLATDGSPVTVEQQRLAHECLNAVFTIRPRNIHCHRTRGRLRISQHLVQQAHWPEHNARDSNCRYKSL